MLHIKFGFGWPSGFREEDLEIVDGRRTPNHGHPISSLCEPNGSGELKNQRTNGPVNTHLRSAAYTNKHV